ncbi:MAG: hypothetical protein NTU88_16605 [Armatimonadetes bacterium]|nr:hypothetical protein [Armatimonadota bacterium]
MKRTLTLICAILLMVSMAAAFGDNSTAPQKTPGSDVRVTLSLKDVTLNDALQQLFERRRANYVVEPMPHAPTVTITLNEVLFEDALAAVSKAAGATYRIDEDGTYYISPLRSAADEAMEAELLKQLTDLNTKLESLRKTFAENNPEMYSTKVAIANIERKLCQLWVRTSSVEAAQLAPKPADKPISEVIQLRYLRPADIAPMLQTVSGVRTITSVGTNKLLVTGTRSAIEEVKTLVAKLDDESAFPKPVRVKVEVRVHVTQSGQKPSSCSLSSDGVGAMGSSIPVQLTVMPPPNDSRWLAGQLYAGSTPSAASDRTIGLQGNGSFTCRMGIGGENIIKPFTVAAVAAPGKPVVIASGSYAIEDKTASFEVLAIVTIDQGPVPAVKKPSAKPHK